MSKAAIRQAIRCDDIKYDPFGTALSWHFAIARVLYMTDSALIPASWDYNHGAGYDLTFPELVASADDDHAETPDVDVAVLLDTGATDTEELVYWGNVLSRYAAMCERAGRSY